MTTPQTYVLNWKDSSKPTIVVPPEGIDSTTSLVMYGWNKGLWAEGFLENFLKLLDNSSSADIPTNPTRGELWHDASTGDIKLFTGNMWKKLGTVDVMSAEPSNVTDGQMWYDIDNHILKYQSNGTWIALADSTTTNAQLNSLQAQMDTKADKVSITPVTATKVVVNDQGIVTYGSNLLASDVPPLPWTKLYDTPTTRAGYGITDAASAAHEADTTIHLTSAEKTLVSGITVTSDEINNLSGVVSNVQTQLNSKVSKSGDIMTGDLSMSGSHRITNLADPLNTGDAITLNWMNGLTARPTNGSSVDWNSLFVGLTSYYAVNSPDDSGSRYGITFKNSSTGGFQFSIPTATVGGIIPEARLRIMSGGAWSSFRELAYKDSVDASLTSLSNQISTKLTKSGDTMTGPLSMNSNVISNLGQPVAANDAATKTYVDAMALAANDLKASVRVASTTNVNPTGLQTIDGISLIVNDRVLLKDQLDARTNGIYAVSAGIWSRVVDFDTGADVSTGSFMFVEEGNTNSGSGWMLITTNPITIGTTYLTFTQFTGTGQITAGSGMSKTGNTLNIGTVSSSRVVVNNDDIDLAMTSVTPGAYNNITVDAYGRATAGTNSIMNGTIDNVPIGNTTRSSGKFTTIDATSTVRMSQGSGSTGGNIKLAVPSTGTTLAGDAVIEVSGNLVKIYENGGTSRGGYFDLSTLDASAGTNLVPPSSINTLGVGNITNGQLVINNGGTLSGITAAIISTANAIVKSDSNGRVAMGWIWNSLPVTTSTITLANQDSCPVSTAAGVVTVNLPASPAVDTIVEIYDVAGACTSTNYINIGRNGSTIMGLAEDMQINSPNMGCRLRYKNGTWRVVP